MKRKWSRSPFLGLESWLVAITTGFALMGPIVTIPVGSFHLFPFRVMLPFVTMLLLGRLIGTPGFVVRRLRPVWMAVGFFIAWFLYGFVALAWSGSVMEGLVELGILASGIMLLFAIASYFGTHDRVEVMFRIWLGILLASLAVGVWEYLTGHHLSASRYGYGGLALGIRVPTGQFFNENDFATFLALSIPFLMAVLQRSRSIGRRLVFAVALLVSIFLMIQTGSRANVLAVAIWFSIWGGGVLMGWIGTRRGAVVGLSLVLSSIAVVGPFAIGGMSGNTFERFVIELPGSSDGRSFASPSSENVRILLARDAFELFVLYAGLGVGPGNSGSQIEELGMSAEQHHVRDLHSWWLQLLVEYGVFVLAGFVALYVWMMHVLWIRVRRGPFQRQAEALFGALAVFPIASFSSSSLIGFTPLWVLLGVTMAFIVATIEASSGPT